MCEFSGVTFHPWVGKHYRQSCLGVRLLVLGESHYEEDDNKRNDLMSYPRLTNDVVTEYIDGAGYPFFTKLANVLLCRGNHLGDDAGRRILKNIAFYNYVQRIMSTHDEWPTEGDWCRAEAPFRMVLKKLQPQAVLILGIAHGRLADHVSYRPEHISFKSIVHPSAYFHFCYEEAIMAFKNLLDCAKDSAD